MRKLKPHLGYFAVAILGSVLVAFATAVWWNMERFPDFQAVRDQYRASDVIVADRTGLLIGKEREDFQERRGQWTPLSALPVEFVPLLLAAEDRRYFHHAGVDVRALFSALYDWSVRGYRRGASTLTMQVVRMLDAHPSTHSVYGKFSEVFGAVALEWVWSKSEILEAYVNLVPFRGEQRGIAGAAGALFGKVPQGLTVSESAYLVALLPSPNAPSSAVFRRAQSILARAGMSDRAPEEIPKMREPTSAQIEVASAFTRLVRSAVGHTQATPIRSTIDREIQSAAREILARQVESLESQNVSDGAVVVFDNPTGEVLAYVANSGVKASRSFVDGVQARRQAGSTLKPFLYARAFEQRILTAATLLEDTPLETTLPAGIYQPKNYDRAYRGLVSAREALASSMNIPAVRVYRLVGGDEFFRTLNRFGFTRLGTAAITGESAALGSLSVSLYELTNAYRAFANRGMFNTPVIVMEQSTHHRSGSAPNAATSEGVAAIISDILADRESRSATFGLESALATRFWSAAKTGTSRNMVDNWCVGFSTRYTVGVWVGNFSGEPMRGVSGVTGAAPVWLEVMNFLHRETTSGRPEALPPGVTRVTMGASSELFLEGTEPEAVEVHPQAMKPRIERPLPGALYAVDQDIPSANARVEVVISPGNVGSEHLEILCNGVRGEASGGRFFCPQSPGRLKIGLKRRDSEEILDSREIEIRGAS